MAKTAKKGGESAEVEQKTPEIEIIDEPAIEVKTAEKPEEPAKPEDEIVALKAQLEEQKKRAGTAEERRQVAERERDTKAKDYDTNVKQAQNNVLVEREKAIESALSAKTSEITGLKRELKEALDAGNTELAVDIQDKMADAKLDLRQINFEKGQLAAHKEKVEKSKPEDHLTPATRSWIAEHPRFNTDTEYRAEAVAGHEIAVSRGIKPDSDEYFRFVEARLKRLGLEEQDEEPEEPVTPKAKPSAASTAAPASYSAPTGSGPSKRSFRLTPEMREMAHNLFGPTSSYKLSTVEAEKKYAAAQLDIQERRARGERI
jgi:hypothetical protein